MNKYVFFSTCDIHDMGGVPYYYRGKAQYLESQGWKVLIFHPGNDESNCLVPFLNKYVTEGSLKWPTDDIYISPSYRNHFMNSLAKRIQSQDDQTIILETHDYWTSPWVELLARKIHAKHIILELNELTEDSAQYYQRYMDFYLFKLRRKEHFCIEKIFKSIYHGIDSVTYNNALQFELDEDPVSDVENKAIEEIKHNDWNIGYIGRANKGYVPNIIDGVCRFAERHTDHEIQFVVVGNFSCRKELFDTRAEGINNIKLIELGDLSPLPKRYFSKVDVVIGGSGSARCSVYEGKLTLVADAQNYLCNGLLGYETQMSVYHDSYAEQTSFDVGLEKALVQQVYRNMHFRFSPKKSVEECCKQNLEAVAASDQTKKYYPAWKISLAVLYYKLKTLLRRIYRLSCRISQ